jgi:hypothetical protein
MTEVGRGTPRPYDLLLGVLSESAKVFQKSTHVLAPLPACVGEGVGVRGVEELTLNHFRVLVVQTLFSAFSAPSAVNLLLRVLGVLAVQKAFYGNSG